MNKASPIVQTSNPSPAIHPESSTARPSADIGQKNKIQLAPDQPFTADGKPRERVYIACRGCRSRKVRCDGAKPVCFNCRRHFPNTVACNYDEAPKRRGRDKAPGMRERSTKGTRKTRPPRGCREHLDESSGISRENSQSRSAAMPPAMDHTREEHDSDMVLGPRNRKDESPGNIARGTLSPEPSVIFVRETWWESLLVSYACEDVGSGILAVTYTSETRMASTQRILTDIRYLFQNSVYWGSFIHIPRFFESLLDPARRSSIQPSVVLSMLALGTLMQSSDLRKGAKGRSRALQLADQAHAAIQASLSANWVDIGLVQAAWLLAYFEMHAHPRQSDIRNRSSFLLLDSLIRLFSLTTLDANLPGSRFSLFAMHADSPTLADVQCVHNQPASGSAPATESPSYRYNPTPSVSASVLEVGCRCAQHTLGRQWPRVLEVAPSWQATAMWPDHASEADIRREECRRLVWSSVILAAGHNSYASARGDVEHIDLSIKHYDNFALLLPGDALARAGAAVSFNDIWALHLRAMLLWHTGLRMRSTRAVPELQRAQFAIDAWLEADAIEHALNLHTCNLEARLGHHARELLFSARMCISSDFQRYLPHVSSDRISTLYRAKCETWLRGQMAITQSIWEDICTNPDGEAQARPLLLYWFMGHITRALILWENDPGLTLAIDAAKTFVIPLEYLMQIWPSPTQREKWEPLRFRLVEACLKAGFAPPTPALPSLRSGLCT
ncbi:hypothetical protein C8Q77DRAFT_270240 [Trametes polyzona]|nr:hypothetical protein C8Q77DRAFT_270240 [Trametes polyzona]